MVATSAACNGLRFYHLAYSTWHYADFYVQDKGSAPNNYSLYDFFNFSKSNPFTQITGSKYSTSCFLSQSAAKGCFPQYPKPPDSDAEQGELD